MLRIGHTSITWGIPGDLETAYRETAELGYLGFETFGKTILEWNGKPGSYQALMDRAGIPTVAAYCYATWIDPVRLEDDLLEARRQTDALRALCGETLVLQAGPRPPGGYDADQFRRLAVALTTVGRYCAERGIAAALHPHTNTAIETGQDIATILDLLDPSSVGFAPDTGQIAKGGGDVLAVLRSAGQCIRHVHLKDWAGPAPRGIDGKEMDATGYANYAPVGSGVMPIPAIFALLEEVGYTGWINVELDGTPRAPRPPCAAAAMSREYLGTLLGDRVKWRH